MSEPLAERLSRFTPDGTGLDRDALLFAAGRASAPAPRRWMALAGLLAASQVLTLVCLWPGPVPPPPPAVPQGDAGSADAPGPPPRRDPSELGALRERLFLSEGDLPAPAGTESPAPAAPPLRAFGDPPSTILN